MLVFFFIESTIHNVESYDNGIATCHIRWKSRKNEQSYMTGSSKKQITKLPNLGKSLVFLQNFPFKPEENTVKWEGEEYNLLLLMLQ